MVSRGLNKYEYSGPTYLLSYSLLNFKCTSKCFRQSFKPPAVYESCIGPIRNQLKVTYTRCMGLPQRPPLLTPLLKFSYRLWRRKWHGEGVGSSKEGSLWEGYIRPKRAWLRVMYQVYKAYVRFPPW